MFIGRYYHTIEEHGRVSLPKKFREASTEWVITRGLDGGVFVFINKQFEEEMAKLQERAFTKKANRDFIRLMTNDAHQVETDDNGRILIPDHLRATAQLTKDVVIVGSYQRIEIWDVEKYHQYIDQLEDQAEAIAEQVSE